MSTHRKKFIKKYDLEDQNYSLEELAEISNIPIKILQEVYNRGIGAYKTNPQSVRMKETFEKNVNAPMSQKLSKEQWAMARVYSFLDGSKKHDEDLRTCPNCGLLVGGVHETESKFITWVDKKWDNVLVYPPETRRIQFLREFGTYFPTVYRKNQFIVGNNKNDHIHIKNTKPTKKGEFGLIIYKDDYEKIDGKNLTKYNRKNLPETFSRTERPSKTKPTL
jgi:hypothetical protein